MPGFAQRTAARGLLTTTHNTDDLVLLETVKVMLFEQSIVKWAIMPQSKISSQSIKLSPQYVFFMAIELQNHLIKCSESGSMFL